MLSEHILFISTHGGTDFSFRPSGMDAKTALAINELQEKQIRADLKDLGKNVLKATAIVAAVSLAPQMESLAAGSNAPQLDGGPLGTLKDIVTAVDVGFESGVKYAVDNWYTVLPTASLTAGMIDTIAEPLKEGENREKVSVPAFIGRWLGKSATEFVEMTGAVLAAEGVIQVKDSHATLSLLGKTVWPFIAYPAIMPDVLIRPVNEYIIKPFLKSCKYLGHKMVDSVTGTLENVSDRSAKK